MSEPSQDSCIPGDAEKDDGEFNVVCGQGAEPFALDEKVIDPLSTTVIAAMEAHEGRRQRSEALEVIVRYRGSCARKRLAAKPQPLISRKRRSETTSDWIAFKSDRYPGAKHSTTVRHAVATTAADLVLVQLLRGQLPTRHGPAGMCAVVMHRDRRILYGQPFSEDQPPGPQAQSHLRVTSELKKTFWLQIKLARRFNGNLSARQIRPP